jgi:hypothetical protein
VLRKRLRLIVDGYYQHSVRSWRLARDEFLYTLKAGPAGGGVSHNYEAMAPDTTTH